MSKGLAGIMQLRVLRVCFVLLYSILCCNSDVDVIIVDFMLLRRLPDIQKLLITERNNYFYLHFLNL